MIDIGPQRFQPKSLSAIRAEIEQVRKELGYDKYLNLTRQELTQLLGTPTDISNPFKSKKYRLVGVYKYINIEYHFDLYGKVYMVFSDTDENGNRAEPLILARHN